VRETRLRNSGAGGSLLSGALDMRFVEMVAGHFPGLGEEGKIDCREEPLPRELLRGVLVFLFGWGQDYCGSAEKERFICGRKLFSDHSKMG